MKISTVVAVVIVAGIIIESIPLDQKHLSIKEHHIPENHLVVINSIQGTAIVAQSSVLGRVS